jgi:predicted AlkP superfamily phosphohydrolase/phosphomutase
VSGGFRSLKSSRKPGLLVVGLDGAGFDVLMPLIRQGHVPNIARLVANGAWGDLESTVHPLTPLAWTSFLSGQNPGKHGIFDFFARIPGTYNFRLVTSSEREGCDFIDILSSAGRRVVSLNVPLTYPPRAVNGAVVSGMGTPSTQSQFTYPRSLKSKLIAKCPGYTLGVPYDRGRETIAKVLLRMVEARTKAGLFLMDEFDPDIFLCVYSGTDVVQHLFWRDFFEPDAEGSEKVYADLLRKVYASADAGLGEFIGRMGGDVPVLMVSDHGAQGLELVVGLNRFLADKGYLAFFPGEKPPSDAASRKAMRNLVRKVTLGIQRMLPIGVKENLKKLMPGISEKLTALRNAPEMSAVDFPHTKAFAVGSYGSIFINVKGREPLGVIDPGTQYEDLCEELKSVLMEWKTPDGVNVVADVQRREELYHGPLLERAPDLLVRLEPGFFTRTSFAPEKERLYEGRTHPMFAQQYQSIHSMHGICIASGYPFISLKKDAAGHGGMDDGGGVKVDGARIIDLAPTILHAAGLEVPDEMDGVVLKQLFDRRWYEAHPPKSISSGTGRPHGRKGDLSPDEEEQIKKELQGLGYIQ